MALATPFVPIIESLPRELTFVEAVRRLSQLPGLAVLDSALPLERLGRYSFIVADPFETFVLKKHQADPIDRLAKTLDLHKQPTCNAIPFPFQGGAVGFFSYEFGRCFEKVAAAKHNEFDIPLAAFGFYDVVLAWDHQRGEQGMILSQGMPETDSARRSSRAQQRLKQFKDVLSQPARPIRTLPVGFQSTAHGLNAPQFETRLGGGWLGNFDSHGFRRAVDRAKEYIAAGDIFQVNLSQRLMKPADVASLDLYCNLRTVNPAPFAGFFVGEDYEIISASPERFLQIRNRHIETRPIKGTRRRTGDRLLDEQSSRELQSSPKDRAENTMIVDLLRNDLSRVCQIDSLRVPQWCEIEQYPFVTHMVSAVSGKMREDATITDLVRATFPGGSITGAPKIRAMEIISELEPTVRGPYCGSMGYLGFDGTSDFNILIRTITASRGWWQFQVGGGIVADSVSEAEEEETWTKAAGLVAAIQTSLQAR